MINEIEKIIANKQKLAEKLLCSSTKMIEILGKSRFKYSGKAQVFFSLKSGYLLSSILQSSATNNPYAASIIFRSLIEHYFRHLYIFLRALKEDSDLVGEEYYNSLRGDEDLKSFAKISNFNKIIFPAGTAWNIKGEHNARISNLARNFDISNILTYISKDINSPDLEFHLLENDLKVFLKNRLTEYTNLSSSVHGGPFAESILNNYTKNEKNKIYDICNFSSQGFIMYKSIMENTFLFTSLMNDSFKKEFDDFKNINLI